MIRNQSGKRIFAAALLAFFFGGLLGAQAAALAAPTLARVSITKPSRTTEPPQTTPLWVSLQWQDNSMGEDGFLIRLRVGTTGPFKDWTTATANATSSLFYVGLNNLAANEVLQFQVVAFSGPKKAPTGYSAPSNNAEVTVPADKFDAPSDLTATALDGGIIELKWVDNSTTEEGFAIELRNQGETAFTYLGSAQFNSTSVQISGFGTPGQLEEFRIRAVRGTTPAVDVSDPTHATTYAPIASVRVRDLFTSASTASGYWGEAFSFPVTTSQPGLLTGLTVTGLPDGLTFDSATGTITGTPTATGTTTANVTATFSSLSEVVSGEIAITILPPAVTSRAFEPATIGVPLAFEVTTSDAALRSSLGLGSPLPDGLSYDAATHVLSGTPTQAGVYKIPVSATFTGYASPVAATLTLRVRPPAGPPADVPGAGLNLSIPEGGTCTVNLSSLFYDPDAGSAVRLQTNLGGNNTIDILLYPDSTPETVASFLKYVDAGDFDGTIFHRSIPGFIVQGGGFLPAAPPNNFLSVAARPSPVNEPGISNVRGTVAMAKIANQPNSATTNFFFNLADNSANLDNQNEGFTAFGRVSASSLAVMDGLAAKPTSSYSVAVDGGAAQSFDNCPVNADTAPAALDNTKMLEILSAERIPVLTFALPSDPSSDVAGISLNGETLNLTGLKPGTKDIDVEITDLDGNKITRQLHLAVGQTVQYSDQGAPPVDASVFEYESGTPAALNPANSGNETAYRWLKDGKILPKATSATLAFPAIKLTDAGAYRRIATTPGGDVRTSPMLVGVLEFSRQPVLAKAGGKVVLTAKVAGPGFSVLWEKNGGLLSEISGKLTGVSTPELTISSLSATDSGTYQCALRTSGGNAGLIIGRSVSAVGSPVVKNIYLSPLVVSQQSSFAFHSYAESGLSPVKFTMTGLPSGLTYDHGTGVISGRPTVAGNYQISVTAANAFGSGMKKTFPLVVSALPAGSTGTFTALVARDATLNSGLGGLLTVAVSGTGAYSGKIVLGTEACPFKGVLDSGGGSSPHFSQTVTRKDGTQVQMNNVTLDSNAITATLVSGTATSHVSGAKTVAPTAAMTGLFNVRFSIPAGDPNAGNIDIVPQGHGFAAVTIDNKGAVKIAGKLADGSSLLTSSAFGFGGKIPMHVIFASKNDVLLGTSTITQATNANPSLSGAVEWLVASTTGLVYPASFGPQTLDWKGAKYLAPAAGTIVLGLADQADNAALSFFDANLVGEITNPDVTLRVKADSSVVMPATNPAFVTLKIDPVKGAFSGTFQFADIVAGKSVTRKPTFQGLLITGSGGFGCFILPQLPSSSRQPGLSGAVELRAP